MERSNTIDDSHLVKIQRQPVAPDLESIRSAEHRKYPAGANRPFAVSEYFAHKMPIMRILGFVLLVLFAPVILLSMLAVRLTSRGPVLFQQQRVGKDGREFWVLKIRTMVLDAEDVTGPVLCTPRDSRVTPLGRVLRFLHLDELPQLVNVVRGEMCLIGPRPERREIIERHRLNEKVPGFKDRTNVLPGVTGLAQINLPADQTAECVIPKVRLDREYIRDANAWLDIRILLCTAFRLLGVRHGFALRLFGLKRDISHDVSREKFDQRQVHVYQPRTTAHQNGHNGSTQKNSTDKGAQVLANSASGKSVVPQANGNGANSCSTFRAPGVTNDVLQDANGEAAPKKPR